MECTKFLVLTVIEGTSYVEQKDPRLHQRTHLIVKKRDNISALFQSQHYSQTGHNINSEHTISIEIIT